jgi:hypothetical protein
MDPLKDGGMLMELGMHTGDYQSFDSDCKQTMIGFVQQSGDGSTVANHNVQCFYAKQNKNLEIEDSVPTETGSYKFAQITNHNEASLLQIDDTLAEDTLVQVAAEVDKKPLMHRKSHHLKHKPNAETDKLIELINTNNFGWKADPCKLQKHHHMYA